MNQQEFAQFSQTKHYDQNQSCPATIKTQKNSIGSKGTGNDGKIQKVYARHSVVS